MDGIESPEVAPSGEQEQAAGVAESEADVLDALLDEIQKTQTQPTEEGQEEQGTGESQPGDESTESGEETEQEEQEGPTEEEMEALGLSDQEIQHVKDDPKSGFGKRIGQLVKKNKLAEERIQNLEQQLKAKSEEPEDPLKAGTQIEDNPFSKISTLQEAQEKAQELDKFIEEAEDLLDDNPDHHGDDVILEENGEEYTKSEVRKALRLRRKQRKDYLPARASDIKLEGERAQLGKNLEQQLPEQVAWMKDEESAQFKQYTQIIGNDSFAKMEKAAPEVPSLRFLIAHAVNSLSQIDDGAKKTTAQPKLTKPNQTPPSSPSGNAALSSPAIKSSRKMVSAAMKSALEDSSDDSVANALMALDSQ